MSLKERTTIFLIASFLSAIGDTIMVFAVPAGLGLETKDIRSAVLLWLVPAVAMFLSSYLKQTMHSRKHSARSDYGKLLVTLAIVEVIVAVLAWYLRTPIHTLILISIFIFLYALVKEGIPRLFYFISVYRFFIKPGDFAKIAGINSGLNIAASFIGAGLAGFLILKGDWRVALIFDAFTFVIFGLAVLVIGKDEELEESGLQVIHASAKDDQSTPANNRGLRHILIVVPLLYATNALVWNYLPLLSQQYAIVSASTAILLMSIFRIPGMIGSFFIDRILGLISKERLISFLPGIFVIACLLFTSIPSIFSLIFLITIQGILAGIYWPVDMSIRNQIPASMMINYNAKVLRRLAGFQFISCCVALIIFDPELLRISHIPFIVIGFTFAALYWDKIKFNIFGLAKYSFLLCLLISQVGCYFPEAQDTNYVEVPSLSLNLDIRPELTYAATAILNDTSAHLVVVGDDLTLRGQTLSSFKMLEGGKKYILNLDPSYRSFRGETISAEDIIYSIKYYLVHKKSLAGAYREILSSDDCIDMNCTLPGVIAKNTSTISISLSIADTKFMEKLASPWLVLLKFGRSPLEKIGKCTVPYQTGIAIIDSCDSRGMHLKIFQNNMLVNLPGKSPSNSTPAKLLVDNPGMTSTPTLTVLSFFAIAGSSNISPNQRLEIMNRIRNKSNLLAGDLNLKGDKLLAPHWLGIETPPAFNTKLNENKLTCPKKDISFILDTSEPNISAIEKFLKANIPCPMKFIITDADNFFEAFSGADFALIWFTPDYLDIYNTYTSLDCANGNQCYFDWKDQELQAEIEKLKISSWQGLQDKNQAIKIEQILVNKGYVVPISEMNWWIKTGSSTKSIHAAGLFQLHIKDFL